MPSAHAREALRFVIGPAASGICRVPGTALPFTKSTASCACALGTRLSRTLQKPGRQRAAG
ncbi:unnamed protein product [Staurois parvus]|uniref:Uncharacterized protein n=1 Tax=Staurois parvus TaxID=386267 RepID=A0ABN9C0P6_9NEOB|nr:unnamed protein product [Staurois parvus]